MDDFERAAGAKKNRVCLKNIKAKPLRKRYIPLKFLACGGLINYVIGSNPKYIIDPPDLRFENKGGSYKEGGVI